MRSNKFTYTDLLDLKQFVEEELDADEDEHFYGKKFRKIFYEKINSTQNTCRKDRDTRYKDKFEKANRKKLGQKSRTKFINLCTWIKIQEPELMQLWERYKT